MKVLGEIEDLDEIERVLIPGMVFDLIFEEMIQRIDGGALGVGSAERMLRKIFAVLIPAARAMLNEWDRDMVMELELKDEMLRPFHVHDVMRLMFRVVAPAEVNVLPQMLHAQARIIQLMIDNKNRKLIHNQILWWHEEMHSEFVEGNDIVKLMVVDLVEHVVDILVAMQFMDTLRRLYPQIIWMSGEGPQAAMMQANIEERVKELQMEKGLWRVVEADSLE